MHKLVSNWIIAGAMAGIGLTFPHISVAQKTGTRAQVDKLAEKIEPKVIEWRRDIHQHPELGNREVKTAEKIAAHLKSLGIEVQTGVAHTGVVGVLKGAKPGPVVALRADIDALPVTERVNIPFASKVKTTYNDQEVGVMHACGHDTHVAMLMGAAEILSQMKNELKGTVKFIFQPAEEGAPRGEEGGAALMVKEGVLEKPKVDVVFGLHINAQTEVGTIKYRPEGVMASADVFRIVVNGKQTHGAYPWNGVDPIVVSAQIINSLQTIVSRHATLTDDAAVVTVGSIHGGVRNNIIPEQVVLEGTIRAFSEKAQEQIHERIKLIASNIATSAGASAEVEIIRQCPVTHNNAALTEKMLPTLNRVAGAKNVMHMKAVTGAEDFSFYQQKVPGLFLFVGGMTKGKRPEEVAPHHTPDFFIDESGMKLGVRTLVNLTMDYMEGNNARL